MDKITDFLKEIRTRFSSPLFSSFIIAWLIINWQIPVALIFYKMEQLAKDGYYSYFDLIKKAINIYSGLCYPLISALSYTLIYPMLRNLIRVFYAWADRWGTDWSLDVAKSGKISVERYIKLRETYKSLTKTAEEVLAKEAEYVQKNAELISEKLELQKQVNNWQANHENLRNYSQLNSYNGEWQVTHLSNGSFITENAIIGNGNISVPDSTGKLNTICEIIMVSYSSQTGDFVFLFRHKSENTVVGEVFQIFRLRSPDNRTMYSSGTNIIIRELRRL